AELELHPEWLDYAAEIFARSDLVVEMLSRHPEEIRVLADPGLGGFRGPLSDEVRATLDEAMAAVRVRYRRSVLATVVRALLATAQPSETFATLTRLAEEVLRTALEAAASEVVGRTDLADGPLAVLALGRLGTGEMDIGSDVDLIFVTHEGIGGESRE